MRQWLLFVILSKHLTLFRNGEREWIENCYYMGIVNILQ